VLIAKSNNHKRGILLSLIIILLLSLTGCTKGSEQAANIKNNQASNSFPLTITDDMGRKVTIQTKPERIVSLVPSSTEILFALGLGDKVVGNTTYCNYPEEAKSCTKVGGFDDPNLEIIVTLKPDLVLATNLHEKVVKGLEDVGINVLVIYPNKLEEVFNSIELIGRATGTEDKAIRITTNLRDRVKAISQKAAQVPKAERPTVYYEMWYDPLMSVGKDSMIAELITLAGGINITDDCQEEYPQISEELIIEKDPQVMINSYGHADEAITAEEIAARKGWEGVSFVKNKRIYSIESDLLELPSPRLVEGLEQLAQCLYPEQ